MSYYLRTNCQRQSRRKTTFKSSDSFFIPAGRGTIQTKREKPFFQAKLTIGEPDDQYEKEADTVANNIVNYSEGNSKAIQRKNINRIKRLSSSSADESSSTDEDLLRRGKELQTKREIQRINNPQEEQEKDKVQMKTVEEEQEELGGSSLAQKKPESSGPITASSLLSSHIESSAGKGSTLSPKVQAEMQSSFGRDFSGVSIHTDQKAVVMNRELGAQAFTHGKDIFFNSGKYNPETREGKGLLAHELTHVVQQSSMSENQNGQYAFVKK